MAQLLTKKRLTEGEIDDLIIEQLTGNIDYVYKEFDFVDIQIALNDQGIEICAMDIFYSILRLKKSGNWTIKTVNPSIDASGSASDEADYKYKIRVTCDVKLAQKTQKEKSEQLPQDLQYKLHIIASRKQKTDSEFVKESLERIVAEYEATNGKLPPSLEEHCSKPAPFLSQ